MVHGAPCFTWCNIFMIFEALQYLFLVDSERELLGSLPEIYSCAQCSVMYFVVDNFKCRLYIVHRTLPKILASVWLLLVLKFLLVVKNFFITNGIKFKCHTLFMIVLKCQNICCNYSKRKS